MNSQNRILDAAERVVIRDGVARLTLDAVAAEAGLSKGGVLYHFPSKDALVRGMVSHLIAESAAALNRSIEADPEVKGRYTRAILAVNFPDPETDVEHHNRVAAAMLAAILTNPALLEPVYEAYREVTTRLLDDGIDPVRARIVHLAADGLWMAEMLGMPGPGTESRRQIIATLYQMTRE